MPIGIFLLYGGFIAAQLLVLAMLRSTGNFMGLFPASLWLSVDLVVAIASMLVKLDPGYQTAILPRLLLLHSVAFAGCLAWMAWDAWRGTHPLAGIFFWALVAIAAARLAEIYLQRALAHPLPWMLLIQGVAVFGMTALMVMSLLMPIPPAPASDPAAAPPAMGLPMFPATAAVSARAA